MNSSTNQPPKHIRKFQFETDFDQEDELLRVEALNHAEELEKQSLEQFHEPEPEPAPSFSEEELHYAREEAFRKGQEHAVQEARQSADVLLVSVIENMTAQTEQLLAADEARTQQARMLAVQTMAAVIKKMWPAVTNHLGHEIVLETIRQSLDYNPEESRIVIRVHDTMLDHVIDRLPDIQAQKAFAGKVIVLADQGIGPADCKVEWADGGMERLSRDLSSQLDSAVERILALMPSKK